jgi:hypothetical protein
MADGCSAPMEGVLSSDNCANHYTAQATPSILKVLLLPIFVVHLTKSV